MRIGTHYKEESFMPTFKKTYLCHQDDFEVMEYIANGNGYKLVVHNYVKPGTYYKFDKDGFMEKWIIHYEPS